MTITIDNPNQDLWDIYSDLYKSVYNFRPRGYVDPNTPREEILKMLDVLQEDLEAQSHRQKEEDAHYIKAFEDHIAKLMADHGIDRKTAMRWDAQANDIEDLTIRCKREEFEYWHGLPFGYLEKHP